MIVLWFSRISIMFSKAFTISSFYHLDKMAHNAELVTYYFIPSFYDLLSLGGS